MPHLRRRASNEVNCDGPGMKSHVRCVQSGCQSLASSEDKLHSCVLLASRREVELHVV
jgi:hypothetical protein